MTTGPEAVRPRRPAGPHDAAAEFPQQRAHSGLWAEGWEKRNPDG